MLSNTNTNTTSNTNTQVACLTILLLAITINSTPLYYAAITYSVVLHSDTCSLLLRTLDH